MTRPVDNDERAGLAMDLLLTSFHGRPLPWVEDAEKAAGSALALADAFLKASAPAGDAEEVADMPQALRALQLCAMAATSHGLDGMAGSLRNVWAFLAERPPNEPVATNPDPHALLEIAVAFCPTVDIGNAVVELLLAEDDDEAFRFQGPRAAILGLAEREFDNPEEALDALREAEARERHNVEMGERLARASNPPMAQRPPSPPEATPPADDSDELVF